MSYLELILADTPSLLWPLDATYGVTDQSGNSRDGTANGTAFTIGGFASSPISGETSSTDFPGVDQRVDIATYNPYVQGSARTFEGWALKDTNAAAQNLSSSPGSVTTQPYLEITAADDVVFRPAGTGGTATTWTDAWLTLGTWQHWALVFDDGANAASLYKNGALVSTQTNASTYPASSSLKLGARATATGPFDGKMAYFAVYERALSASEIASHYAAGVGSGAIARRSFVHEAGRGR